MNFQVGDLLQYIDSSLCVITKITGRSTKTIHVHWFVEKAEPIELDDLEAFLYPSRVSRYHESEMSQFSRLS